MKNSDEIRVAVCGELPTACAYLQKHCVAGIDHYDSALDVMHALQSGIATYDLVMVYAPQGEGFFLDMRYKTFDNNDWVTIPVRTLDEPACSSALAEMKVTLEL